MLILGSLQLRFRIFFLWFNKFGSKLGPECKKTFLNLGPEISVVTFHLLKMEMLLNYISLWNFLIQHLLVNFVLITIERFYIYAEHLDNNHLNDDHTIFPNTIFETLLKPHQP
jgi:hypothetical protein